MTLTLLPWVYLILKKIKQIIFIRRTCVATHVKGRKSDSLDDKKHAHVYCSFLSSSNFSIYLYKFNDYR